MSRPITAFLLLAVVSGLSPALALAQSTPAAVPAGAPAAAPAPADGSPSQLPRTLTVADKGPQGDFPPPPPEGRGRTGSFALFLGPGWLALRDDIGRDGQMAQNMGARVGMIMLPNWQFTLGFERTWTDRGEATFSQMAGLVGAQVHFGRFYLGGAVGLGWVRESGVPAPLSDGPGASLSGTVGVELLRGSHVALSAEVTITGAQYKTEAWEMGGVRLGLLVF